MDFEFASAGRIVFGVGAGLKLRGLVRGLGVEKVLVVVGRTGRVRFAHLFDGWDDVKLFWQVIEREPTVDNVREGVVVALQAGCDVVVAVGGGSAIDLGKAIAAVATNGGEPMDFCEVVGKGLPLKEQPLPFVAVPTTAGTGSEVTKNAVVKSEGRKVSIRSESMLPNFAIIDPLLHVGVPSHVTAASGMDALTQCIEPYISRSHNPFVDILAVEGIRRAVKSLQKAYVQGDDISARTDMAMAALLGGLSLANAKLGAVHGFAGVIGGLTETAHGAICAALLAPVFALNAEHTKDPEIQRRYLTIANLLTGKPNATVDDAVQWLHKLTKDLSIPSLKQMGLTENSLPDIAEKSKLSSSMKGNPVDLTTDQLLTALHSAFVEPNSSQ